MSRIGHATADRRVDRPPTQPAVDAIAPEDAAVLPDAGSLASRRTVRDPASYRDPSGFVYRRDGHLLRQIHAEFAADWQAFTESGLADRLIGTDVLVRHEEVPTQSAFDERAWRVIRPEPIPFVSYPYEWTFGALKDAALLTLRAESEAVESGFTLKDASAYNVQFRDGRPILVDSLSFERAAPDSPWIAYKQFCEHFLSPLALMALRDVRAGLLLREFVDGIPLDLASRLLPGRSRLRFGLLTHLHLHARAQARFSDRPDAGRDGRMSTFRLRALLDNLRSTVEGLSWRPAGTEWADYAENTTYDAEATASKRAIVERFLRAAAPRCVWDLGANTGVYSRAAAELGARVVAFDLDAAAAERHYRSLRAEGRGDILPLVIDLTNPSPGLGWAHRERRSLEERADADALLALALLHHLAIGRNVPLPMISSWFAALAPWAIVEFVPRGDPMVDRLLASRRDIFSDYTRDGFRDAFSRDWQLVEEVPIEGSARVLFLLRRLAAPSAARPA